MYDLFDAENPFDLLFKGDPFPPFPLLLPLLPFPLLLPLLPFPPFPTFPFTVLRTFGLHGKLFEFPDATKKIKKLYNFSFV